MSLRPTLLATVVLCSASSGAAAWQRPEAHAAPKVEACPGTGEGFVRIPGSDTCIRVGGSVRVEGARTGGGASYLVTGH